MFTKSNTNTFFLSPTTPEEVLNILNTFNLNKANVSNCIPVKILKDMKSEISLPLSTPIILSFNTRIFPGSLKLARVMPIFKKGDQQDCNNYRPISVLSNISKLIEKLLYKRLYKFLNQNKCLYNDQFGFRNHHSTNPAFIILWMTQICYISAVL